MLLDEFEKLTGFYPSLDLYAGIEAAYQKYPGDKNAFCDAYVSNRDGMADEIARRVDWARLPMEQAVDAAKAEAAGKIRELEAELKRVRAQLEREEEWKPFEDKHNVSQADYEHLAASDARELTDEEAADMIAREFGFDRVRISIVHEVYKQEMNRHNRIRNVGVIPRKALFEAWDWNYICFNVCGSSVMGYEMYNGELQMYWS